MANVDEQVHHGQEQEGHSGQGQDEGERPKVFVDRNEAVLLRKAAEAAPNDAQYKEPRKAE